MSIPLPAILYRCPGPHDGRLNGKWVKHATIGAWTDEQLAKHLAAGWLPTLDQAHSVHAGQSTNVPETAAERVKAQTLSDLKMTAPSRDTLEMKARELGLDFDGRTTDRLLTQRIFDALGG